MKIENKEKNIINIIGIFFMILGGFFLLGGIIPSIIIRIVFKPLGDELTMLKVFSHIFGLGGLIFFFVGFLLFYSINKGKYLEKKYKKIGTLIYADYIKSEINNKFTMNGVNPYEIICTWIDPTDGVRHDYRSESLWFDPSTIISKNNITKLPVYIDPNNKDKYYLDVSSIIDKNN